MHKRSQLRTFLIVLGASIALGAATSAFAQMSTPALTPTVAPDMTPNLNNNSNTSTSTSTDTNATTGSNQGFVLGSKLMGTQVKNERNEKLGTISNVVVNPETGHIRYAVIDAHGRKVTVPWNALNAAPHATSGQAPHFTLNTTKDKLAKAPKFNPNDLSNLSNRTAEEPIFTYYDIIWFPDVLSSGEQNARSGQGTTSGTMSGTSPPPSVTPYGGTTPSTTSIPYGGSTPYGGTTPSAMTSPGVGASVTPFPTASPH